MGQMVVMVRFTCFCNHSGFSLVTVYSRETWEMETGLEALQSSRQKMMIACTGLVELDMVIR